MTTTVTETAVFPTVVAFTDQTVTLGFTHEGNEIRMEFPKTMIKGQARWAAKRMQQTGATVPEYGTKECKDWATSLRTACRAAEQENAVT